ncbi:hypothetical protein MUO69_06795, partial [Candidatus Bathyarchaeota archaeon]|nr:hypothetical protein [Candidatus Bathyarchaeota archaeon]
PANTTSPFNVTIPISFMWGDFSVLTDDVPQPLTASQNATHTTVQTTVVVNSTRHVRIYSTEVVPEYNPAILVVFLLIITLSTITMTRSHAPAKNAPCQRKPTMSKSP